MARRRHRKRYSASIALTFTLPLDFAVRAPVRSTAFAEPYSARLAGDAAQWRAGEMNSGELAPAAADQQSDCAVDPPLADYPWTTCAGRANTRLV